MKYTLTLEVAAMDVVTTLTDENDNQKTQHFAYEGMTFPSDPVTPDAVVLTLTNAIHTLVSEIPSVTDEITTIRLSGVANGWVALDENFAALTDVISGADNRADKYVDALMINGIGGQLQRKGGVPLTPMTPVVLTLWMKNELPDVFAKAQHFMGMREFILHRLFGLNVVDVAHAARTGFYNVAHNDWDVQALAVTGLTAEQLPAIIEDVEIHDAWRPDVLAQTGLRADAVFSLQ